ncbi:MAG: sec-independent protein translocase protein TatC [Actinomycetota bacterium]|jgi:sec-independent protein translocase protein TatC|nr:sec-independent protein translocase protein TatC [Actinomycetota bacterium]
MGDPSDLRKKRKLFRRLREKRSRANAMTILEHLGELRSRLIVSAAAFVVISVVAFFFFKPILAFLLEPLCSLNSDQLGPQGCNLIVNGPIEPFLVRLKMTAIAGIVFSAPVWLYQIWAFVTPGLSSKEKKYAVPFVLSSFVLFSVGITFAYLTLTPGLKFLIGVGQGKLVPFFKADTYLNFIGLMFLGFGVTFELPLLLFFLGLAGAVTVDQLREHRRAAIVAIVFLAAVVTPSQDPYTLLVLAVPLYLLYEGTILLLRLVLRKRGRSKAQSG